MVRKLQKKFILIVALVLFLVLGGLVGTVNGINYWQTEQKTDVLLNMLLDNDGTFPENSPGNQGKQEHSPENRAPGADQLQLSENRKAIRPVIESMEKQKQFITDAGHELKTPIAIISANTEVIEMCSGESEWTESIHHQTERLTSLVTQLLTLAKMDEGGGQLELKEWNASETIIEAVQSFEAPAVTKQITLQTDIAKELRMEGDAARIHQLVSLLVDNAVKYTPEGGKIRIFWRKNGKKAEFSVQNTCDTLPEGDLNRLFDRFYRADVSRARESGGYGIGLSVAAAIVKAHKGKITAEWTRDGIYFKAVFPVKG